MTMERKTIMGLAAVAGIGVLLYLRKNGADAATGAAASTLNGSSWATQPTVINVTTKPVVDEVRTTAPTGTGGIAQKPLTPTKPVAQVPVFGGGGRSDPAPPPTWTGTGWAGSDGAPASDSYAFGFMSPEQRKGRTDGEIAASVLGW